VRSAFLGTAIDATYTFDENGLTADQISAATAASLDGHFATVTTTDDVLARFV